MPSLDACYPELVARLDADDRSSGAGSGAPRGWEAALRAALSRGPGADRSERTVRALDQAGLLEPYALTRVAATELRDTLAESGVTITDKTAALVHRLAAWYAASFPDHPAGADRDVSTPRLRAELLAINGVGQGTADAILLALGRPSCPIDPGIYRILVRHGWCEITADYEEASESLGRHAGEDPAEIERLTRGLSRLARKYCGVRAPKCTSCPLCGLLPESGPIDPEA
jgi:endonuclease III